MDKLASRTRKRIASHKYCTVFEHELVRVWPRDPEEHERRAQEIRAFAEQNGLSVIIRDPGIRAVFRALVAPPARGD